MAFNDMLIKLYDQKFERNSVQHRAEADCDLGKPIGADRVRLLDWIGIHFPATWQGEAEQALGNRPVSCFIAQHKGTLLGFSCYDATALGFFGPLGVIENARGRGIGSALVRACMLDMRMKGYGYAVVGMAGTPDFYRKVAAAVEIPDSSPGIYRHTLNSSDTTTG